MATSASLSSSTNLDPSAIADAWHPSRPRRFLPLDPTKLSDSNDGDDGVSKEGNNENTPLKLRGIIFDVDGTLCLPQNYMFRKMRSALGIDKSVDILDHIRSLSGEADNAPDQPESSPQLRAQEAIRAIERNAMTSQRPQPGLLELMTYLERRSIPKALCTRNFPAPVQHLIDNFLPGLERGFDAIITRETVGVAPKPSPEGLWWIARNWKLDQIETGSGTDDDMLKKARKQLGSHIIMVGDSIDDMAAGYRAGAATVLLLNEDNNYLLSHEYVDLGIRQLDELIQILDDGFVGQSV